MSTKHTHYVAGFMFSPDQQHVALIRKDKPAWQAGKLNGIGGKVEDNETACEAMIREFEEEAGLKTLESQWNHYCSMKGRTSEEGDTFEVNFFAIFGFLAQLQSMEAEKIEIVPLSAIYPGRIDMVENLPWLVSIALDHLNDGRPDFVEATYP